MNNIFNTFVNKLKKINIMKTFPSKKIHFVFLTFLLSFLLFSTKNYA